MAPLPHRLAKPVAGSVTVAVAVAGVVSVALARRAMLGWGATTAERRAALPGDDLVPHASVRATRAITVGADAGDLWPWIAQLGQGRGGFYSYDVLENLIGCDIHSADQIVPAWQTVEVGDEVRLHPGVALEVAVVDPGHALVLRGAVPVAQSTAAPYDFTWAFVIDAAKPGSVRLVVRERYGYARWWAPVVVEPVATVSFVMSRRMLRGIRDRAERHP